MMNKYPIILVVAVLLVFAQSAYCGTYGGGAGTAEQPFIIATAEDMQEVGANPGDWGKHFILAADIDLSGYTGTSFNIIGSKEIAFSGVFDGNGYAISNFTHSSMYRRYVGLFGNVGSDGQITNLGLSDVNVRADIEVGEGYSGYIGGLAGCNQGTIIDCSVTGSVSGGYHIGGLVGSNEGTITGCDAVVSVSGDSHAGGLAGDNEGFITNCKAEGIIIGFSYVGGLVGNMWEGGAITNCSANVDVTSESSCSGGLVGRNFSDRITNCYSTGSVSGDSIVGGLIGYNLSGSITDCYSTGRVSGIKSVGGLIGFSDEGGVVTNCYSTGSVAGESVIIGGLIGINCSDIASCYSGGTVNGAEVVGGLIGFSDEGGVVTNCYSTGSVNGTILVGGLTAFNDGSIVNCYAVGEVTGTRLVGGMVGKLAEGSIEGSFWNREINLSLTGIGGIDGVVDIDVLAGAIGRTTSQLQTQIPFTSHSWDFAGEDANGSDGIWRLCVDGTTYPRLAWEFDSIGDFLCPDGVAAEDMSFLAEHWLTTDSRADINGDAVVNLLDYYIMARYWLED